MLRAIKSPEIVKETFNKRDKFSVGETLNVRGNSVSLVIEMYNKKRKREWNGNCSYGFGVFFSSFFQYQSSYPSPSE